MDFVALATNAEISERSMEEVTIDGDSAIAGKSIRDSGLRERFGVVVVAIQREDQRMEFNPEADAPIRAGNKLVVLGRYIQASQARGVRTTDTVDDIANFWRARDEASVNAWYTDGRYDGIVAIGSGGPYALSAARALARHTDFSARQIAEEAMKIAGEICIYSNLNLVIEEI